MCYGVRQAVLHIQEQRRAWLAGFKFVSITSITNSDDKAMRPYIDIAEKAKADAMKFIDDA